MVVCPLNYTSDTIPIRLEKMRRFIEVITEDEISGDNFSCD